MSDLVGQEFRLDNKTEWEMMMISRGDVVEVYLPSTNLEAAPNLWAGFWVKQTFILPEGDFAAVVKSLGCSDPDWAKYFSNLFNRRSGKLHFCGSKPCAVTSEFTMHVTRFKLFTMASFDKPYLTSYIKRQVQKWEEEDLAEADEDEVNVSGHAGRRDTGSPDREEQEEAPGDPRERPPEKDPDRKKAGEEKNRPKEKKEGHARPKAFSDAERENLRKRLDEAREKMIRRGVEKPAGRMAEPGGDEEVTNVPSSSPGYSCSPAGEDGIQALEDQGEHGGGEHQKKKSEKKEKNRKDKGKEKKKKREGGAREESALKGLEDSKGGTTRNLQNQLVLKAAETAKEKAQKEKAEKRRHHRKDPGRQLALILTKAVSGKKRRKRSSDGSSHASGGDRSQRKAKKKKRKKKRSSSPGGGDSPTSSSGNSSGAESSSSSDSKKRLVAPLRKKSRRKPGSVLQMLLQHARSQLDQGAKVQVQDAESLTMTSGVRMGSYFAICVRPQVGNAMAQARELHHIAQAIDLLRQGDLDLLGDVLAGRFMSLHQSVIDGSWATARHLELLPLEEGTAAGPEVVLEAKRHARLAAKLAPADQWNWGNSGKGKGGRGKASSWHDSYGVQKGKGKKGAKGKGKQKGWNTTEKEVETRTREKPGEK